MSKCVPDWVVLLHGIMHSAASMRPIEWALSVVGHQVLNLRYPARHLPLEAVQHEASIFLSPHRGRTHVVAHSLGALVARVLVCRRPVLHPAQPSPFDPARLPTLPSGGDR